MREIGVGVIGCGFVGRGAHVPAIQAIDGARLAAVADPDQGRLEKVAVKYGVRETFRDYQELVRRPEVEAVVVAAPTPLHAAASLAAIEAGKHVLCEMPLASSLDEADQIIEAAARRGVLLMPGLTFRFTPTFVEAKQIVQRGELGDPVAVGYRELIPAHDLAKQWPAGSWVWDLPHSGGPLYTLSVWSIDLLRWLLDSEITDVWSATRYTPLAPLPGTVGYDARVTLKLANGVIGGLQYSGSVAPSASACDLEIVGSTTHVLRAVENHSLLMLADDPPERKWDVRQPGPKMWGHQQQDEHFLACIRDGLMPQALPADGRRAMELAQRIASV